LRKHGRHTWQAIAVHVNEYATLHLASQRSPSHDGAHKTSWTQQTAHDDQANSSVAAPSVAHETKHSNQQDGEQAIAVHRTMEHSQHKPREPHQNGHKAITRT
jgi:hypothetical protein